MSRAAGNLRIHVSVVLLVFVAAAALAGVAAWAEVEPGSKYVYDVIYKAESEAGSVECRLRLELTVVDVDEDEVTVEYNVGDAECRGDEEIAGLLGIAFASLEGIEGKETMRPARSVDPLAPPFYIDLDSARREYKGTQDLGLGLKLEYEVRYDENGVLEYHKAKVTREGGGYEEELVIKRPSGIAAALGALAGAVADALGRLAAPLLAIAAFAGLLWLHRYLSGRTGA